MLRRFIWVSANHTSTRKNNLRHRYWLKTPSSCHSIPFGRHRTDISIHFTSSITRVRSVCVSWWKDYAAAPKSNVVASTEWTQLISPSEYDTSGAILWYYKVCEYIFSWWCGEFKSRLQNGSKTYHAYPIRSRTEVYCQRRQTIWQLLPSIENLTITAGEYGATKFKIGSDTEEVVEAMFTKLNTRATDSLMVRF